VSVEAWLGAARAPRRWQVEALPLVLDACRARRRPLVSAVMGAGKSILMAELAALALPGSGGRAVVLSAPTQRLVRQLSATVAERVGSLWSVGRYYADEHDAAADVVVACNDSLPALAEALRGRRCALAVLDEAHRSQVDGVLGAVRALAPAALIGFTATPFRSLPRESLELYDVLAYHYDLERAVVDGCLVPPRVVRWEGLDPERLDEACLEMIRRHAQGPGIVSATGIEDAERYAAWLSERGVSAAAIHSRQGAGEQDALLARLRSGEVSALVHVSLLAEGVDLPWLRWICLRRATAARVRFLQELGRVLRVSPGKSEGLILDPHLLLGRHGLESVEAIGKALEQAALAEDREERAARKAAELGERQAVALDALTLYLRELREALEREGCCGPRWSDGTGDGWRLAEVSAKQVARIERCRKLTRYMPGEYRGPIKALIGVPWALTRGQASDLLDVLIQGRAWAIGWFREPWQEDYQAQWDADLGLRVPATAECKVVAKMVE
jgi:superfamily II DNA or RNA helicase